MVITTFDPYKVQEIKVLTRGKPDHPQVLELLQRVANQVQPIMRRRKWTCPLLKEFFPKSSNLLGLNFGGGGGNTREISIRVRRAEDASSLFDFNDLLGTMLHELTHNVRSPHDTVFYKILDELWEEADALMDKGITCSGQGFDAHAAGRAGVTTHNPTTQADLRAAILKAADARSKQQALMPKGPRKLGGTNRLRALPPGQAAAAAAAKRARDNLWCPNETLGPSTLTAGGWHEDPSTGAIVLEPDCGGATRTTEAGTAPPAIQHRGTTVGASGDVPPPQTQERQQQHVGASQQAAVTAPSGRARAAGHEPSDGSSFKPGWPASPGGHAGGGTGRPAWLRQRILADTARPAERHGAAAVQLLPALAASTAAASASARPADSAAPALAAALQDVAPAKRARTDAKAPPAELAKMASPEPASAAAEVVDLTLCDEDEHEQQRGRCISAKPAAASARGPAAATQAAQGVCDPGHSAAPRGPHCVGPSPAASTSQPQQQKSSAVTMLPDGLWACGLCTLLNKDSSSHCRACDAWRYSTGRPAASRPTLGGM